MLHSRLNIEFQKKRENKLIERRKGRNIEEKKQDQRKEEGGGRKKGMQPPSYLASLSNARSISFYLSKLQERKR